MALKLGNFENLILIYATLRQVYQLILLYTPRFYLYFRIICMDKWCVRGTNVLPSVTYAPFGVDDTFDRSRYEYKIETPELAVKFLRALVLVETTT